MSRLLFENSKFAVGFAGVTLGGAALFAAFGGDSFAQKGEDAPPPEVAEAVEAQAKPRPAPISANQPEIEDFVPDEELIDNTNGFDPTPDQGKEVAELNPPGFGLDGDDGDNDEYGFGDANNGSSNSGSARNTRSNRPPRTGRPSRPSAAPKNPTRPAKVTVKNQKSGNGPRVTVSENVRIR